MHQHGYFKIENQKHVASETLGLGDSDDPIEACGEAKDPNGFCLSIGSTFGAYLKQLKFKVSYILNGPQWLLF